MSRISQAAYYRQRILKYVENHTVSQTAIQFKCSRKTVYKWIKRYDGTLKSLEDRSHRPHHSPKKHSAKEVKIIKRILNKYNGKDLILVYQELVERFEYKRTYGGLKRFINKEQLHIKQKRKVKHKPKPYQRAAYPGQKVQIDVKHIPLHCSIDGSKKYVFIAVDECSRWTFRQMYDEKSSYSAFQFLKALIGNFPLPIREIQTDNGTEFTNRLLTSTSTHVSLFEKALQAYEIKYHKIRVATPRHNGKVERQNGLDDTRFYNNLKMYSLEDGRKQLESYNKKSNNYIKTCLQYKSPSKVIEEYVSLMM